MKGFLQRFSLLEFFSYICPGSLFLVSLLLWVNPDELKAVFESKAALIVSFLFVLLAYTLGLILSQLARSKSRTKS